jgi:hypothetical protein
MSTKPNLSVEPADFYTRAEAAELIAINHQLHKKVLKYKTENRSLKEQITLLEDELDDEKKAPRVGNILDLVHRIDEENTPKL